MPGIAQLEDRTDNNYKLFISLFLTIFEPFIAAKVAETVVQENFKQKIDNSFTKEEINDWIKFVSIIFSFLCIKIKLNVP